MQSAKTAICYTCAYNAEKTISRTIDSVLNQTYTDFKYYIYDNGSADKTREIIYHYASLDNRIIPLHGDINHLHPDGTGYSPTWIFTSDTVVKEYDDGNAEYVFYLDADDEYLPGFLEEMIAFLEDNNLDLACCGSDFITAETGELESQRILSDNLILEGEDFDRNLLLYHDFTRTVWAKLYRISLIKKCDYGNYEPLFKTAFCDDCIFSTRAYLYAGRVGILAKVLHKYYVSKSSTTFVFDKKRPSSMMVLYNEQSNFIKEKTGHISPSNKELLNSIHLREIFYLTFVLLNSQMSDKEKLNVLHEIFSYPEARKMATYNYTNATEDVRDYNWERNTVLKTLSNWILSGADVRSGNGMEIATDILAAINIVYSAFNYAGWTNGELFSLYVKTYMKTESEKFKEELEDRLTEVAARHSLLTGCTAGFLIYFYDIALCILEENLEDALEMITDIIENGQEIPENTGLPLVELGLLIAATIEKIEYFIFMKKVHISLLIEKEMPVRAKAELDEWRGMIPHDEDFAALNNRLQDMLQHQ